MYNVLDQYIKALDDKGYRFYSKENTEGINEVIRVVNPNDVHDIKYISIEYNSNENNFMVVVTHNGEIEGMPRFESEDLELCQLKLCEITGELYKKFKIQKADNYKAKYGVG